MQMSNEEIVKEYKESKNKKGQIQILAELNACDKEKIINILISHGMLEKKKPKAAGKEKVEKVAPVQQDNIALVVPEIVIEALSQKMIELQENIDICKAKQKESEEQLDVLSGYLRKCI